MSMKDLIEAESWESGAKRTLAEADDLYLKILNHVSSHVIVNDLYIRQLLEAYFKRKEEGNETRISGS
jgi:hypothetical protein